MSIHSEFKEVYDLKLQQKAVLSDDLKVFIQSGNYEPYILDLMNQSRIVFPSKYERNEVQSEGQCDFFDTETLEKYEAKLPFDKKEGELICRKDSTLKEWIEFMMKEEEEFGKHIIEDRGKYTIESLQLYRTLEKRLNTVREDENAIILFPYPITFDMEPVQGCLNLLHMASDILSSIFAKLLSNGVVKKRNIYAIYPSIDGKIVLRHLNKDTREYLFSQDINKIFSYSFLLLED